MIRFKGMSQKTIMTVFWIIFAIGALAVLFLLAQTIFIRLVGVQIG